MSHFSPTSVSRAHQHQQPLELLTDRGLSDVTLSGTFVSPDPVVAVLSISIANSNFSSTTSSSSPVSNSINTVWTAESGGWLRVRNSTTGEVEQQKRIGTNGQEPTCMCYCPRSNTVWVGTSDGPLVVYRASDAAQIAECMLHESGVTSLLYVPASSFSSSSSSFLWSAGSDGRIAVWDTAKCSVVRCFHACPQGPVNCLAIAGSLGVAANGDEGDICIWPFTNNTATNNNNNSNQSGRRNNNNNGEKEEPVLTHKGAHASTILSLCSVSSTFLWSGAEDGSLRVWTFNTNNSNNDDSSFTTTQTSSTSTSSSSSLKLISTLRCHNSAVHCIAKEPAGNRVWTASLDGRLALWDADRQTLLTQLPVSYPPRGNHFIFSVAPVAVATAQRIWSCSTDGTVRSWLSICPNNAPMPSTMIIQQPPPPPPPAPSSSRSAAVDLSNYVSIEQHDLETQELYHRLTLIHGEWARGLQLILQNAGAHWCRMMQVLRDRANAFAEETEEEIEKLRCEIRELSQGLENERKYRLRFQNEAETLKAEMDSRVRELQRRAEEEAHAAAARQHSLEVEQLRLQRTIDEQERTIGDLRDALNTARGDNMELSRRNEKLGLDLMSWEKKTRELDAELRFRDELTAKLKMDLEKTLNALTVQEATNERAFARASDAELERAEMEMEVATAKRQLASLQQQLRDVDHDYKAHVRKLDSVVEDLRAQIAAHQREVIDLRNTNERAQGELLHLRNNNERQQGEIQHLKSANERSQGEISQLRAAAERAHGEVTQLRGTNERLQIELEREKASFQSLRLSSDDEIRNLNSKNSALRDEVTELNSRFSRLQERMVDIENTMRTERDAHAQMLSDQQQSSDAAIAKLRQESSQLQNELDAQKRGAESLRLELGDQSVMCERERERNRELRAQLEDQQRALGEAQRVSTSNERRAVALSSELETARAAAERHSIDLRETLHNYNELQEKFGQVSRRAQEDAIGVRELHDEVSRLQNECRRYREQNNNLQCQLRDNDAAFSAAVQKERKSASDASVRAETLEQSCRNLKQQMEELSSALATERGLRSDAESRLRAARDEKSADQHTAESVLQDLKNQLHAEREIAGRHRAQLEQLTQENAALSREAALAKDKASRLERENTIEQASGVSARDRVHHLESALEQAREELRAQTERTFKEISTLRRSVAILEAERDSAARVLEEQHGEIARLREQAHSQSGDLVRRAKELGMYSGSGGGSPSRDYAASYKENNGNGAKLYSLTPRHEVKSYHDPIPASFTYGNNQPASPEIPLGGYRKQQQQLEQQQQQQQVGRTSSHDRNSAALMMAPIAAVPINHVNNNNVYQQQQQQHSSPYVSSSGVITPMWSPQPRV